MRRATVVGVILAGLVALAPTAPGGADGNEAPGAPASFRAITAGLHHTCAILEGGAVKCWGENFAGQLGLGDTNSRGDSVGEMGDALPAVDLGTGRTAMAISAGRRHTCAILDNGALKCWGDNDFGALGLGDTNDRGDGPGEMGDALPTVALGQSRSATAVTLGNATTCALLDDARVKCWGYAAAGQLGRGNEDTIGDGAGEMGDALDPIDLGTGRTATAVTAAGGQVCARLDTAQLKCWGHNGFGQSGHEDVFYRGDDPNEMGDALVVTNLGGGRTAAGISSGGDHACALLDNARVKCWGSGGSGRLGLGDTAHRGLDVGDMGDNLPSVDLGTGRTATAVTAGGIHACALLDDGSLKCWGDNTSGKLGIGDTADRGDGPGEMGDALPVVDLGAAPPVATCDGRPVTVDLSLSQSPTEGDDVILGTPGPDTINALGGADRICAGGGADTVNGGDDTDRIFGQAGNDTLRGGNAADRLDGGLGNDRAFGQNGNDTLNGQVGADVLDGGANNDRLNGGTQRDTCHGRTGNDSQSGCEVRTSIP